MRYLVEKSPRKANKRSILRRVLACVICALLSVSAAAQTAEEPRRLGGLADEAEQPTVAIAPDGRVGCAWVSHLGGSQTIAFREKIAGQWSAEKHFGGDAGSAAFCPTIVYDKASNPHLFWRAHYNESNKRSRAIATRRVIEYAFRHSGLWFLQGEIAPEQASETTAPAAAVDSDGRLHVTWLEGTGSFLGVVVATFETSGTLRLERLTAGQPERLNLCPSILNRQEPRIFWFSQVEEGIKVEARQYDADSRQWLPDLETEANLADLPANRLPHLFGGDDNVVCAVWFESIEDGAERVMFGLSGPTARGGGIPADDNPGWPNRDVFGVLSPDWSPVVCWRGETADGPAIFVRKAQGGALWFPSVKLSVPDPPYPAAPCMAAGEDEIHLVWISDTADGGAGGPYYSVIRWQ